MFQPFRIPFAHDSNKSQSINLDPSFKLVAWTACLEVEGRPKGGEIALLRGDLSKGDAEALLRFAPGYKVPNHSHTSDELYMWISGAFTLIAHDGTRTAFAGPTYITKSLSGAFGMLFKPAPIARR